MAGLDSMIQAAGRCNREGRHSSEESRVYLFDPEERYTKHLPYSMLRAAHGGGQGDGNGRSRSTQPEAVNAYFTELYRLSGPGAGRKTDRADAGKKRRMGFIPFAPCRKNSI